MLDIARFAMTGAACALLAACNSTGPMSIPMLAPVSSAPEGTSSLFGQTDSATIRLEKVVATLDRGQVVAHFPAGGGDLSELGDYCNHRISDASAKIEWAGGRTMLGDWSTEFGKIFYEMMQQRGYNVVGNPQTLFGRIEEIQAAEYLLGARITDIRGNYCQKHHWWDGRPLRQFKGESYVKVEWEVFSSLARRVVYRSQTEGYAKTTDFSGEGIVVTIQNAFADAVDRVAGEKGLRRVVSGQTEAPDKAIAFGRLTLIGPGPSRKPVKENTDTLVNAVATIQLGTGHGSGFLVAADGYILTNAHVVGDGKRVPVLFDNGLRVSGEVIRVAKRRDVALVKIPVQSTYVLPIARRATPKRFDEVYVVGSPRHVSLRSTITKGIVSAVRREKDGNIYIQSDAAVTGGSSGGPMVDARGNVIGIAVAKVPDAENVNLFIPIDDALAALNIAIATD